jgi:hypothetical protein
MRGAILPCKILENSLGEKTREKPGPALAQLIFLSSQGLQFAGHLTVSR